MLEETKTFKPDQDFQFFIMFYKTLTTNDH